MVYNLYGPAYDEAKIIDPEFWMTEEDYERFETPEVDNT